MPESRHIPKSLAPLVAAWEFDPPENPITNRTIAAQAGVSESHARVLASRLVKEGWLERAARGQYQFIPAAMGYPRSSPWPLLAAANREHLVSGLSAARTHRLTPQIPSRHLVIFSREGKPPQAVAASPSFRVVRFRPDRIFGGEPTDMDGTTVVVARTERVMIDAAMHPDWVDGIEEMTRILRRGFAEADLALLIDFVRRYRSERLTRRIGWWGETLLEQGWPPKFRDELQAMLRNARGGERTLVPSAHATGQFDNRWALHINVPDHVIREAERVL